MFGLDYSHVQKKSLKQYSDMLKDMDKVDNFIFDFIPITALGEQRYAPEEIETEDAQI